MQKTEMSQLSKRSLEVQQALAKHDMATHKVGRVQPVAISLRCTSSPVGLAQLTEDNLELRSTADQLRHENNNLKSEREVFKSAEKRLSDENASLSKERAHRSDLMRNLQTMANELERSGNDARRRLEEQVTRLEAQAYVQLHSLFPILWC